MSTKVERKDGWVTIYTDNEKTGQFVSTGIMQFLESDFADLYTDGGIRENRLMEDVVLYTVEEIAKVFRVNHVTVRNLIKRGDLYAVKIGRGLRVPKSALDAYFDRIGHPIAPAKPVVEVKEEAPEADKVLPIGSYVPV